VAAALPAEPVKRVSLELMHLTLAFIGWAPDETAAIAGRALRNAFADTGPIACRLGAVGAFPTANRPRVIWVGLAEGEEGVRAAAVAAREALRAANVSFDDKPPVAHLTVARVRDEAPRSARDAIADVIRGSRVEPLRFEIGEAILFESRLARSGPTYIPLERIPLPTRLPSARPER
jgi:2'-5' RNA ligase